jgi:hypothetical protein
MSKPSTKIIVFGPWHLFYLPPKDLEMEQQWPIQIYVHPNPYYNQSTAFTQAQNTLVLCICVLYHT